MGSFHRLMEFNFGFLGELIILPPTSSLMSDNFSCVFLIDDERSTNFYNQWLLNGMGFCEEVQCFSHGKEALEAITTAPSGKLPDLILLDVNMPEMNGFEFLEIYRKEHSTATPVFFMLTNPLLDPEQEKAVTLGITGFIDKPLTEEKMQEVLSGLPH